MFKSIDGKKKNNPVVIIIIITVLLLGLSLWFVYSKVTERVVDNNVEAMKEISLHDKHAVEHSIANRLDVLHAIGQTIKKEKPASMQEAQLLLQSQLVYLKDAENLLLLDESGNTYKNSGLIEKDDVVKAYCDAQTGEFVVRYNRISEVYEMNRERLMMAVPVNITIDGIHITHIVGLMNINSIKDELKIDSYDGRGYSSIIDRNGNYIVNIDELHTLYTYDNFFEDMKNANVKGHGSVQNFIDDIGSLKDSDDAVSAQYELNGVDYAVTIVEIPGTDWYFITNVPMSVFRGQSNSIMIIFAMLVAAIMIVFAGLGYTVLRNRRQYLQLKVAEEREKNTEIIEKQNEELERQHADLEKALAMAESASRAKTTFLNNMSHDIRTPMNAIIGYTGMAQTHIDNKDQVQTYLDKISKSSNHLLSLINDVLDMSRIESGKMTLNEKPESLSEIVHTLRDIVQSDIHAKSMELFIDVENIQDETVICDKLRLNQVLLNIISNSIKYTQNGGNISLRIKQNGVDEEGRGRYEFRVKDNGMGMSKEFLTTIFDPFTRVRSSTVSGIQGTGLGMAITKNIVDLMGGTITVESEEEKGTEVILNFNFALKDLTKEMEVIPELKGLKSLVVDDDMLACNNISKMLIDAGLQSEWCVSGKEALFRCEEAYKAGNQYKVYIIDWLMPDMNGVETARRIRRVVGKDSPIIILTAYDWSDIEDEAKEAGVTGFVSKPMFPSDLRKVLLDACGIEDSSNEEKEETYDFTGKKILLVEDNEMNREIAIDILKEDGFIIDTAEDGTVAVEKIKYSKPGDYDLILMDIQMPVMDGYEATRQIRALEDMQLSNITIIAMTANAFEEDKVAAIDAGMNDHLSKPIDVKMLKSVLARYLK